MPKNGPRDGGLVLFVDVLPFVHSTRTRKIALSLAENLSSTAVEAITLQRVGRTGIEDLRPGFHEGRVSVKQVRARQPFTRRTRLATLLNLLFIYPPSVALLAIRALRRPADVLVLGSTSLVWLGVLHQRLHGSYVVVNARERLNGIRTVGSLGTLISKLEPRMIGYMRRRDVSVVAVCQGHADEFLDAGVREVLVVRNLPRREFNSGGFQEPPELSGGLRVVLLGSLYEGRGIEALIEGVAMCNRRGYRVSLEITGRGSAPYLHSLKQGIAKAGASSHVSLLGPCAPEEVPARYARGHIGTALYEAVDRANDSLSNKLFESVASGRPVLAGDLTENRRVVSEYGLGWTAEVNASALAERLTEIVSSQPDIASWGRRCFELSRDVLNWESDVAPLLKLVKSRLPE